MNISLNIPAGLVERMAVALERIAKASEHIAFPVINFETKPYPATDWGYTSNAESRKIEEEERREAEGFGPAYEREIEARAGVVRTSDLPDRFEK